MKVLVLGGCGIQGRTALYDLAADGQVSEVICADARFETLSKIQPFTNMEKITTIAIDATNGADLFNVIKQADVAIDLLPKEFADPVNEAALAAKVSVVNTNYMYDPGEMDDRAKAAGMAIMGSAFICEFVAGGINAIPRGQWEAGTASGLSWIQQLRLVIIPQAMKVILPPLVGQYVLLIKDTSVVSVIGVMELTRVGWVTVVRIPEGLMVFSLVGALYFVISYPLILLSNYLERRMAG